MLDVAIIGVLGSIIVTGLRRLADWLRHTVAHLLVVGGLVHDDRSPVGLDILDPVAKRNAPDVPPEPPTPTGTDPAPDPVSAWPSKEDNGYTQFIQIFPAFAETRRQTKAKAGE